jgi:hypothetical protein
MSKTLFEEAVADANKLRELAEETAKNKVVEAVMPQIRDMINRKILGEDLDIDDEIPMLSIEDEPPEMEDDPEADVTDVSLSHEDGPEVSIQVDGDVEIDLDLEADDSDDLVVNQAMAEALAHLVGAQKEKSAFETKLDTLSENVQKLSSILESVDNQHLNSKQIKRLKLSYMYCLRED